MRRVYNTFYDVFGCTVLHLLLEKENRETNRVSFYAIKRLKISRASLSHVYFSPGNIKNRSAKYTSLI